MDWKEYEKQIHFYFKETYPGFSIKYNQFLPGKYSKTERQIDILIEGSIAGFRISIVVDCKYFSSNIDVKDVESFSSMVEDVDAHQGVLITKKGFSQAAINRAHYGPSKVELDILNFDELKDFQGLEAFPYAENFSVAISAPFGWVIDIKEKVNGIATLFQRGLTLAEAQKRKEWMYLEFWKIDKQTSTIDDLIGFQNEYILDGDPNTTFKYEERIQREDGYRTKVRIAEVPSYSCLEVTGFLQVDKHIFFCVLFTPLELLDKNLRKLEFILSTAMPAKIEFDNYKVIEQALEKIKSEESIEEKAYLYSKIGTWYREMLEYANALKYYKKSLEILAAQYELLKHIIKDELEFGSNKEALKYSSILFEIEPKNPTIPQDLIYIFSQCERIEILKGFFLNKVNFHVDDEIKGNLLFHTGLLLSQNQDESLKYFKLAESHFNKVLPSDHYVFSTLRDHFASISSKDVK